MPKGVLLEETNSGPVQFARRLSHALSWLALALAGVAVVVRHYWFLDLKYDDAWIHYQFSKNLAAGQGFSFNAGVPVLGSGGSLWNFLVAAVHLVTPFLPLHYSATLLNACLMLLFGGLTWRLLQPVVSPCQARIFTALAMLSGTLVVSSAGGMESACFNVGLLGSWVLLARGRFELAGLVAGATFGIRVEALGMMGCVLLAGLLWARPRLPRIILGLLAVPAPLYLWQWWYFGQPFSNSTMTKLVVFHLPPGAAAQVVLKSLMSNLSYRSYHGLAPDVVLWVAVLLGLGARHMARASKPGALAVLHVPFCLAFYGASNCLMFPWYFSTYLPVAVIFGLLGLAELVKGRYQAPLLVLLVALCLGPSLKRDWWPLAGPDSPRFEFSNPNALEHTRTLAYIQAARWLNERTTPQTRVCICEVGAFGYHFQGTLLDGIGLVSPEALPFHPQRTPFLSIGGAIPPRLVEKYLPDYFVSLDVFGELVFADPWFQQHYRLAHELSWYAGPDFWKGVPAELWGSRHIRIYQRL